jgi:ABC-type Fe3+/spermidine/putrescine transport system ATPase subunit
MAADRMTEPDVLLAGVDKAFRSEVVVKAIDLAVNRGEFFSLLGPSGCGKTTTLRMIAGLERPTRGTISIRGRVVNDVPIDRRPTNLVFQKLALFPHLNVYDNIAFGLRLKKVPAAEIRRRVAAMLETVHLTGFGPRSIASLSGGQQQRVAIARALVNEPAVLLLDEPLGALDLKLQTHLQEELRRIQRELAMTFIYVTHNQSEAMTMSDRIGIMNNGRLEQVGTPADLYLRPQTSFVASFVGQTNLLKGRVKCVDGASMQVEAAGLAFTVAALNGKVADDAVDVSLRPERIKFRPAKAAEPGPILTVIDATFLGSTVTYRLKAPDGILIAQTQGELAPAAPGTKVTAWWDDDATVAVEANTP